MTFKNMATLRLASVWGFVTGRGVVGEEGNGLNCRIFGYHVPSCSASVWEDAISASWARHRSKMTSEFWPSSPPLPTPFRLRPETLLFQILLTQCHSFNFICAGARTGCDCWLNA